MAKPTKAGAKARAKIFPCGYCEREVSWAHMAVACDACDIWFHRSCHSLSIREYENLGNEDSWRCYRCKTIVNDSFSYHSYELAVSCDSNLL